MDTSENGSHQFNFQWAEALFQANGCIKFFDKAIVPYSAQKYIIKIVIS